LFKKIIILLIAVSIMLTSCGKLTGLLNSDKKADNKSLVGINNNDNVKQSGTDFAYNHWFATGLVLVVGSFFTIKWIIKKIKNEPSKKLKPLPEIPTTFKPSFCKIIIFTENSNKCSFFVLLYNIITILVEISRGGDNDWAIIDFNSLSDNDLIYGYYNYNRFSPISPSLHLRIKNTLEKRGYDVSPLQ
jgi:hypothetical protein